MWTRCISSLAFFLLCASLVFANEYVATGYAPLDPKAVKGMCYSGNPHITASGLPTTPGRTLAAPKHIPFKTWVLIEGLGLRRVEDRGGRIRGHRIDICFGMRREALEWGKRKVRVFFLVEGGEQACSHFKLCEIG